MNFQEQVEHYIGSGFQVIYIPTAERSRCEEELQAVAKKNKLKFVTWDAVSGFSCEPSIKDPIEAMSSIDEDTGSVTWKEDDILFVFRNLHYFLEDLAVRQTLQNLYFSRKLNNASYRRPIFIVSNALQIHPEIASCVTLLEYTLPNQQQLEKIFHEIVDNVEVTENSEAKITYDADTKDKSVQALKGLTTLEAENILAFSLRVNKGFTEDFIDTIEDQKARMLEKSEILTYIPKDKITTMNEIGGYDELKEFIRVRSKAYSRDAQELGIDLPKGIVLVGVPGTGKSLVGKILARELGQPLIIFNISAIFGSLVGESERRASSALATIDALDGAVVLIDEAEKALGGSAESIGDSGVSRRVFGTLLTWLTEKKTRTFVVLTMNKTNGIPPEFLRRGRFDQIFTTDIPDAVERDEILRIHCKKRNIDTKMLDGAKWTKLIEETDKFVGAELEQVVCDARFNAFANRRTGQPTVEELIQAATLITPLAESERETIDAIRQLNNTCGIPVSKRRHVTKKKTRSVNLS